MSFDNFPMPPTAKKRQRQPWAVRVAMATLLVSGAASALAATDGPQQSNVRKPALEHEADERPPAPRPAFPAPSAVGPTPRPSEAAEALFAGRVEAAVEQYRHLARAFPDTPVYATLADILEANPSRRSR